MPMELNKPKVSVIIPVYNAEPFLVETLECVLTQDLQNIEVVCVDNGSTDRSAYILHEFAAADERVRFFLHPEGGPGGARNRGIDEARGEFLTFLDADDWYEEPTYLSALYYGAVESEQRVSAGNMVNWWGPDNVERDFANAQFFEGYEFTENGVVDWRDWQFDFGFTRFMFARGFFEGGRHRFGGLTFFEDPVFLVRLLDEAGSFYGMTGAHYVYRLNAGQRVWTTRQALDLMRGVRMNLELSRDRDLPKLHSYTVHHFDFFVPAMQVGFNTHLSVRALAEALPEVEAAVDNGLLERAGDGEWLPFEFLLRKKLQEEAEHDIVHKAYHRLRYLSGRM